jgi:hypothetical protein
MNAKQRVISEPQLGTVRHLLPVEARELDPVDPYDHLVEQRAPENLQTARPTAFERVPAADHEHEKRKYRSAHETGAVLALLLVW